MSYFKSIGLTMQAPRLCPLVSPWVILVYKLVNAVALLHVLFPVSIYIYIYCVYMYNSSYLHTHIQVTFVRYWTIPLIIMHITMLSLICDTILCSSLEIMQIVDNPTSVCIEFIVVAWSLITVNIALVYTIILNFDQTSETLSPITQLHILTDDEVFEYFPTNIFEYSKVPCMHEFTYLIRSSSDEFEEKEHLLASMHRDLISIDRQNPCELNPFGLGQTPTQICSRIE